MDLPSSIMQCEDPQVRPMSSSKIEDAQSSLLKEYARCSSRINLYRMRMAGLGVVPPHFRRFLSFPHFGRPQSSLSANEDRKVRIPHSSNSQSEEVSVGSYKNIRCAPPSVPQSEASPQYASHHIRVPQSSFPHGEDPQKLIPQISAPKNEDGPQSSLPQFISSVSLTYRCPKNDKPAFSQSIINGEGT